MTSRFINYHFSGSFSYIQQASLDPKHTLIKTEYVMNLKHNLHLCILLSHLFLSQIMKIKSLLEWISKH
jgi:hypothetical protein